MGRLNGGKDYSSVRVNYSKSESTLLSLHGVFRCVRYVMGTAGAGRLKIRRSRSAEARLAVIPASLGRYCVAAVKGGLLQHSSEVASAASLHVI